MVETRVPKCKCPSCGTELDAATDVLNRAATPNPGDITICLRCGLLMRFKDDMTLRQLTGKEMIEAMKDPRVATIERARGTVMAGFTADEAMTKIMADYKANR
jgi:hypothetical protein